MSRLIALTKGKYAIVDEEDFDRVNQFKWYLNKPKPKSLREYAMRNRTPECSFIKMHRFILGATDPKVKVDHINGNGLDNRRSNLRLCSNAENSRSSARRQNVKSPYRGVSWNGNGYFASIRVNYQAIYLGFFQSPEEAALAYNEAAIKHHGEFAKLNIIDKKHEEQ